MKIPLQHESDNSSMLAAMALFCHEVTWAETNVSESCVNQPSGVPEAFQGGRGESRQRASRAAGAN